MEKTLIKVCLVEDDQDIRDLTKGVLEINTNIQCDPCFDSAESFIAALPDLKVDIILMDIGLPGMNGIECVKLCTENNNQINFIMYTTHFDAREVFDALKVGAKGYILKGGSPDRLVQDILDFAEGGSPMSPQISRLVTESFTQQKQKSEHLDKLTKQEWEVLKGLEKGLNYKEIATERFVSTHTVRAQIRSIYEKLHVHNKVEALNLLK
jgi:DNA-binding NarL/FixJ family response regulator